MKKFVLLLMFLLSIKCAKINTPRVLLPWIEDVKVNFTFEIIEGGCYTWSMSRDDIIDLEPIYDDAWGHCSRAARVSVSKTCVPPGSVIIFAEEVSTGEVLRGDVDIDIIQSLKVTSTTWKLYLEEAPEAFEVVAYDDQGNKFSTLEGVSFSWIIRNHQDYGDEPLVTFIEWRNTDYEAPHGVTELESKGLQSQSVLLYGQAMGECFVTVCLQKICTDFDLQVVASVVLTPATALVAPGDTLRFRVVRVKAGRLSNQDISETLYYLKVPHTDIAILEDDISLIRAKKLGTTTVNLMSGVTEVASSTITVVEPDSIRVTLRPSDLIIRGDVFKVHCVIFSDGHPLWAGDDILIRLTSEGDAEVDLLKSTENGTVTDAVARRSGDLYITARLHSVGGKMLSKKIEGQVSAVAVDPLEVIPAILYAAWTDSKQKLVLKYRGGGEEPVTWYQSERPEHDLHSAIALTPAGEVTINGVVDIKVNVRLTKYPHVKAEGRVRSAPPELIQVSSTGRARVGRPHHLHLALTATDPATGDLYNFHKCDCSSFAVSLLEGPEPHNVTAATWVQPEDGACCVLECWFKSRGVSTLRVSRNRIGDTHRIVVNAAPKILWPGNVAALPYATLPVIAEGEALYPHSNEPRIVDLVHRDGMAPHNYPDARIFTIKCHKKGDGHLTLTSQTEHDLSSVSVEASCAPHVSKMRLEPAPTRNCSNRPIVWLRAKQEVSLKVALLDAIGRELLDERGPPVLFEAEPNHIGIEFKSTDGLFVETLPDFHPVPVPQKFYQIISASEQAIGWSGTIKASYPDAVASIEAKVVAPLKVNPQKVNIAWEGEAVANITKISGGSGRYYVETPKGVSAKIEEAVMSAIVPGPGSYDLLVTDQCVNGENQLVEVQIEEILSVEVSTSRAICVNACVPITALVKGISHIYLTTSHSPQWGVSGDLRIKDDILCGVREGSGRVKASLGNIWSPEVEVAVFPPLQIIPSQGVVPPGSKLQLRHIGGPSPHLASMAYKTSSHKILQVSPTGLVLGVSKGIGRVRLVATDIIGNEMASAEAEIEVVPLSGMRVRAATQTLLVGSPSPIHIEAAGLSPSSLASLQPSPKATWTVRDATIARLYATHRDDLLERSVVDGLSVRVVPLKPGVITIDVRVRNLAQSETRTWDSTIEILAVSDIRTSVNGLQSDINTGERLTLAVGAIVRMKSFPRSEWRSFDDGSFKVTSDGEVRALKPGSGVLMATHSDEVNRVFRETAIHVEVSTPQYCTAEAVGSEDDAVTIVLRSLLGRSLIAPQMEVSTAAPLRAVTRLDNGGLTSTLLIHGVGDTGTFAQFQASMAGVTLKDEVFVAGMDLRSSRIFATGSWAVCLDGIGWSSPPGISLYPGSGVTLALLNKPTAGTHSLKLDRVQSARVISQAPLNKFEFSSGDYPYSSVPLTIEAAGLSSGPVLCSEDQKYAVDGVEVQLPFVCRTKLPHTAEPYIDVINGELGCSIVPATLITEASDVELCAEWDIYRTCTKVLLLPQITTSASKVSLLSPPTIFSIQGHPQALKMVKLTSSPGLKLEMNSKFEDITVTVKSETTVCGIGWVNIKSKLTSQELRVEVERECDIACGTLLGALLSLLKPYLTTLMTIVAVAAAYLYVQSRMQAKGMYRAPMDTSQSFLQRETSIWRLD